AQLPTGTPILGTLVKPVRDEAFGAARPAAAMLLGGVALLLLIACANAANLTLALHAERAREFFIRTALGAGRGDNWRLLFSETLAVPLAAATLGLVLARAALVLFVRLAPPEMPAVDRIALHWPVGQAIAFCGLPTAIALAFRFRPHPRTRSILIAAEVAL